MGYGDMGPDVDIMGIQRGEHKDGPSVCPHYVFKKPGGVNPDGTALFGWNDAGACFCKRCGMRDTAHVILKDLPPLEEELRLMKQKKTESRRPEPAPKAPITKYATRSEDEALLAAAPPSPLQLYELEPGVADPLASSAYAAARKEYEDKQAARIRLAMEEALKEREAIEKVDCTYASCCWTCVCNSV